MTLATLTFSTALGFGATSAFAQDAGQGAIVVRDTGHDGLAPIYAQAEGDAVEYSLAQNEPVAGYTSLGPMLHTYAFENANGRVHVIYFPNDKQTGIVHTAWMSPDDLRIFTYDCSCGASGLLSVLKTEACSPFAPASIRRLKWNNCFVQSRDQMIAELQSDRSRQPVRTAVSSNAQTTQDEHAETVPDGDGGDKPLSSDDIAKLTAGPSDSRAGDGAAKDSPKQSKGLTNKDVVALVKAGLGEKVVIDKIRRSANKLDTSTEALIRLKKAGVSSAIIDAMVKREDGN